MDALLDGLLDHWVKKNDNDKENLFKMGSLKIPYGLKKWFLKL